MANVCQQCGDLGYEALLVYCSLCLKAARHQYCLNDIPELDEHIEWSCEDCSFETRKVGVNGQYLEIQSNDFSLASKENIVSNEHKRVNDMHVARNSKNKANLHVHKHEMKARENTNKRFVRTMMFDSSIDEVMSLQTMKCLKSNGSRRKLILPIEDDDSSIDEVMSLQAMKCVKSNDRRRKLILPIEDDDESLDVAKDSTMQSEINISRVHQSFVKNKHNSNMKKSTMLDKENVDNNLERSSLKEAKAALKVDKTKALEVKSIIQNTKIDDDMAMKAKSKDDLEKSSSDLSLGVHLLNSSRSQSKLNDVLAMPINWRGWIKICGRNYGPLVAHSSPKIGEKAWKAAGSLPQVIQLTMASRSYAYPRSFKISPPTDDHIALTFFPTDSRVEKEVDQLVQEVIRCDLMLKVALDEVELLVFPSNLLPENYKRYQDKHYLWGVFKSKDSDRNTGEIGLAQTYESSAKQTLPNSLTKSQEPQIESDDEKMSLEGDEQYLTDEDGKQTVPNLSIESEEVLIDKSLEGNEPQESLSTLSDAGEDIGMGNDSRTDEELNGCLELFPMQVENMALRLKMGDRKEDVDLELSLRLPFRQLRTLPLD